MTGNLKLVLALISLPAVWFIVWFIVFLNILDPAKNIEGGYDKLSDTKITEQDVVRSESLNPRLPYFVGFKELSKRGISQDDRVYIQDVIINFLLYKKGAGPARISYVKDSYRAETQDISLTSFKSVYEFKFGIDSKDIHTIHINSDAFKKTIDISIDDTSGSKVYNKSFTIIAPN